MDDNLIKNCEQSVVKKTVANVGIELERLSIKNFVFFI